MHRSQFPFTTRTRKLVRIQMSLQEFKVQKKSTEAIHKWLVANDWNCLDIFEERAKCFASFQLITGFSWLVSFNVTRNVVDSLGLAYNCFVVALCKPIQCIHHVRGINVYITIIILSVWWWDLKLYLRHYSFLLHSSCWLHYGFKVGTLCSVSAGVTHNVKSKFNFRLLST